MQCCGLSFNERSIKHDSDRFFSVIAVKARQES